MDPEWLNQKIVPGVCGSPFNCAWYERALNTYIVVFLVASKLAGKQDTTSIREASILERQEAVASPTSHQDIMYSTIWACMLGHVDTERVPR